MRRVDPARDAIFAAIRKAKGDALVSPKGIEGEANALLANLADCQLDVPEEGREDFFMEKAIGENRGATGERLQSPKQVPEAVERILQQWGLPKKLHIAERLAKLNWDGFDKVDDLKADHQVAITLADCAVAETGSLLYMTDLDQPALANFLPEHLIAVATTDRLFSHLEEVWAALRTPMPRLCNVVTGASSSADIQGISIRGAHGPRQLHIILVDQKQPGQNKPPAHKPENVPAPAASEFKDIVSPYNSD